MPALILGVSAQKVSIFVTAGDAVSSGRGLDDRAGKAYGALFAASMGVKGGKYRNIADDTADSQALLDKLFLYETDIADADLIVLSVGTDDIMPYIMAGLETVISSRVSYAELLARAAEPEFTVKLSQAIDGTAMLSAIARYSVNLGKIIAEIKKYSPDIKIVLINLYNPADGIAALGGIKLIIDPYIAMINDKIKKAADDYGCHELDITAAFAGRAEKMTNITSLDIAPSAEGHRAISDLLSEFAAALPELPEQTTKEPVTQSPVDQTDNTKIITTGDPADTGDLGIIINEPPSRAIIYIIIAGSVCITAALAIVLAVRIKARNDRVQ